jgi:conjugal transfer pilus assembly protein TraK
VIKHRLTAAAVIAVLMSLTSAASRAAGPVEEPVAPAFQELTPLPNHQAGSPMAATVAPQPAATPIGAPPAPKGTPQPPPGVAASNNAAGDAVDDYPAVSANTVEHPANGGAPGSGKEAAVRDFNLPLLPEVTMAPGVNEAVPIAIFQTNRLVTPFSHPAVKHLSDAKIEVSGNVIYVATNNDRLITMFITQEGSEKVAFSVTLVPQKIPPRDVVLKASAGEMASFETPVGAGGGDDGRSASPHVEDITDALKNLALGNVPQGYTYRRIEARDRMPTCRFGGLVGVSFASGQIFVGAGDEIVVGVVTNGSPDAVDLQEQSCITTDVAAVAFWPNIHLMPGQKTEVYVLRRPVRKSTYTQRPSLLGVAK